MAHGSQSGSQLRTGEKTLPGFPWPRVSGALVLPLAASPGRVLVVTAFSCGRDGLLTLHGYEGLPSHWPTGSPPPPHRPLTPEQEALIPRYKITPTRKLKRLRKRERMDSVTNVLPVEGG